MLKLNLICILLFLVSGLVYSQSKDSMSLKSIHKKNLLTSTYDDVTVGSNILKDSVQVQKRLKRKPFIVDTDLPKASEDTIRRVVHLKKKPLNN